jgi:acetyl esterase/lipase
MFLGRRADLLDLRAQPLVLSGHSSGAHISTLVLLRRWEGPNPGAMPS